MKKIALSLTVLGLVGAFILFVLWRTSPTQLGKEAFSATGLPTRTLAEAKAMAKEQSKPLLIDFSAYWCPTCRRLDREVLSSNAVKQKINDQYIFVRVDSEADGTRDLMKRYEIYGFPSLVVTDAEGRLIRRIPVDFDVQQFLQSL